MKSCLYENMPLKTEHLAEHIPLSPAKKKKKKSKEDWVADDHQKGNSLIQSFYQLWSQATFGIQQ